MHHVRMQELRHTEERGAPSNGRVVYVHDHDKARREALEAAGGRVVGWVGGYYRIMVNRPSGGVS